jgi:hypothetical protein
VALGFIAGFAFLVGCQRRPTTGGDIPVTTERLTNTRLSDIRQELTWKFDDTTVVIENRGQPIPPDLVQELLGDGSVPKRVEAAWLYDEKSGVLRLSDATADGHKIARELVIPIKPAGQVRVNLGSRQYNLFRVKTNDP